MLDYIIPENIIFIDIETVPQFAAFQEIPEKEQKLWEKKSLYLRKEEQSASDVYNRAGIYAEFGRIICISAGFIYIEKGERAVRIKSFYGDDEKKILLDIKMMLKAFGERKDYSLCAHNGKEFDFPFIARRMLIHGIEVPDVLDVGGKKPWEVKFIDTMELWKFGDYKHYTSIELLSHIFGITSPKEDIDGSMVSDIYYNQKDISRIVSYCQKDVITVIQILLKFKAENPVPEDRIFIVP
jgi:DNA polymerase elongation subunit (family B)